MTLQPLPGGVGGEAFLDQTEYRLSPFFSQPPSLIDRVPQILPVVEFGLELAYPSVVGALGRAVDHCPILAYDPKTRPGIPPMLGSLLTRNQNIVEIPDRCPILAHPFLVWPIQPERRLTCLAPLTNRFTSGSGKGPCPRSESGMASGV